MVPPHGRYSKGALPSHANGAQISWYEPGGAGCSYPPEPADSALPDISRISPVHPSPWMRARISSTKDEATTSNGRLNAGDLACANATSGLTIRRVKPTYFFP